MPHQFPLRLLFVVTTTTAICLGSNLALDTVRATVNASNNHFWTVFQSATSLPVYLVSAAGAYLIFEHRTKFASASNLALIALFTNVGWRFFRPWTQLLVLKLRTFQTIGEAFAWFGLFDRLISSIVEAACWALMIAALFRTAQISRSQLFLNQPPDPNWK